MSLSLSAAITAAKNRLHGNEAWIRLIELPRTASTYLRIASYATDVVYAGNTYTRGLFDFADIAEEDGALSEVAVALANPNGAVQAMLEDGEILNRRATIYWLPERQAGASTGALSASFYVMSATADAGLVSLQLGMWSLQDILIPHVRFDRTRCRWVFKSTECGYAGALTTCNKAFISVDGCSGRTNQASYGGWPNLLTGPEALAMAGI